MRTLLLLLLTLPLGACNIVAPAALLIHGPEKVPPIHTLEPARPTVVVVDVAPGLPLRPAVRTAIARQAGQELLDSRAVTTVIDPRAAESIVSLDRLGTPMPLSEIGRAASAEVVLHVLVESFSITSDNQSLAPRAALRVKVIDATNEARLFPPPSDGRAGYPIALARPLRTTALPSRGTEWNQAELEFAEWVGVAVGQAFHEHERLESHLVTRGSPN